MNILIPEPAWFSCEPDEIHFFAWLNEISAVRSVTASREGLELVVDTPVDKASFYELVGLLTRYDLDRTSVRPLCIDHPDDWFRDRKNYWYQSVFD